MRATRLFLFHILHGVQGRSLILAHTRLATCGPMAHTRSPLSIYFTFQVHRYSCIRCDICLPLSASVFIPTACLRVALTEHRIILPGRGFRS